jgi:hypothetical protein
MKKLKKRKQKKPRNLVVLEMILTRHGGAMQDRRKQQTNKNLIAEGIDDCE